MSGTCTPAASAADRARMHLNRPQVSVLLALIGQVLSRAHGDSGPVCFYVTRRGTSHQLRTRATVARFLNQVGDAHA